MFDELRSTPQLTLRLAAGALYVISGAATPLGGDHTTMSLELGPGTSLVVRSVGAAVARGGRGPSYAGVSVTVATGAQLVWAMAPGVAAAGCDHVSDVDIAMEGGASCWWRDEVVLGRFAERPGRWRTRLHVDRLGLPVLRHHLDLGAGPPSSTSPATVGAARAVGSVVVLGQGTVPAAVVQDSCGMATVMPLATGDDVMVSATARSHLDLRRLLVQAGSTLIDSGVGAFGGSETAC